MSENEQEPVYQNGDRVYVPAIVIDTYEKKRIYCMVGNHLSPVRFEASEINPAPPSRDKVDGLVELKWELHNLFLSVLNSIDEVAKKSCSCVQPDLKKIYKTINKQGAEITSRLAALSTTKENEK